MSEQDAQEHSHEGASEVQTVTYAEGYDDPKANVVILALADKKSLRVHDYYLKASSPFFLDLLEAGTDGGPVPLEGPSDFWRFILDQVIRKTTCPIETVELYAPEDVKRNYWEYLWSMMELRNLTERYMFASVSDYLHSEIIDCVKHNPPQVFLYACGLTPPDGNMAKAALNAFRDRMPGWLGMYFDDQERILRDKRYHVPSPENFTRSFIEALGIEVFCTLKQAMRDNSVDFLSGKNRSWLWNRVAIDFVEMMDWEVAYDCVSDPEEDFKSDRDVSFFTRSGDFQ